MGLLGPTVREITLRAWFQRRPRWFAPWRMRKIWRRGPADYLYLWPDGLFRKEKPQSYTGVHVEGNVSCWRIFSTAEDWQRLYSFKDEELRNGTRTHSFTGGLGRTASPGVKGPQW